ncbi:hypothetical protein AYO21_09681 [Fonsecaea monophora]|uniref:Zn(2)-C6 fungal-type domain-containing protein n=1 Tax=Fonsecaea monophora TaxID=254056 RepID=A0A177EXN3_9EURO|nr:hypothetical protein AYO21_09681 [Fonsecaea monophora]OAG36141.1 hypothetical protein AYO21_09681 [Fonsecaea monophora]
MPDHSSQPASARSRKKASAACVNCRRHRVRCITTPNQNQCDRCSRHGVECIFKDDDERKRPHSKASLNDLLARVQFLEGLLRQQSHSTNQLNSLQEFTLDSVVTAPADDVQRRPEDEDSLPQLGQPNEAQLPDASPWLPDMPAVNKSRKRSHSRLDTCSIQSRTDSSPSASVSPGTHGQAILDQLTDTVSNLLSVKVVQEINLTLEHHSRYDAHLPFTKSFERNTRAFALLRSISPELQDYLTSLYFKYSNQRNPLVNEEAFMSDKAAGRTDFYSPLLHLCIVARGLYYADLEDHRIETFLRKDQDNVLHREVCGLMTFDLCDSGSLTFCQALGVASDLECGAGRSRSAWMTIGAAIRMAFDLNIHVDRNQTDNSILAQQARKELFWGLVSRDRYYTLSLGRHRMIRNSDFADILQCPPHWDTYQVGVFTAIADLMCLTADIVEVLVCAQDKQDFSDLHLNLAVCSKALKKWHAQLPERLQWNAVNVREADPRFFLLHLQLHATYIVLHRPFSMMQVFGPGVGGTNEGNDSYFWSPVRSRAHMLCIEHSIEISNILKLYEQQRAPRVMCLSVVHHLGIAATALISELVLEHPAQTPLLPHLLYIRGVLRGMVPTYKGVKKTLHIIEKACTASGWTSDGPCTNSGLEAGGVRPATSMPTSKLRTSQGLSLSSQDMFPKGSPAQPPPAAAFLSKRADLPLSYEQALQPDVAGDSNPFDCHELSIGNLEDMFGWPVWGDEDGQAA